MNKYLILLLVVCIVSVNAYVKRDAPAPTQPNYIEDIKKHIEEFTNTINEKLKQAINPDEIQKNFSDFSANMNKVIDGLKTPKAQ